MQTILPLELESVFESIRTANRFQIIDGQPVWVDSFHDEGFELIENGQVVDEEGNEYFLNSDENGWYTVEQRSPQRIVGNDNVIWGESGIVASDDNGVVLGYDYYPKVLTPKWVFYECGSISEIVSIVNNELGKKKNMSFPLGALETLDTTYTPNGEQYYDYAFKMYLCTKPEDNLRPKERYRASYEAVLFPLWEIFKTHIDYSNLMIHDDTVTMRERWGRNGLYGREGNVFNDMVDALEIDATVTFLKESCNN